MKKRTLLALAVAMSVTAVAAANPFSDVPARHWAYDSVEKLTKAGVVDGYEDGTFRGERTMTRYEMAQIIARALAKVPTATTGGGNDAAMKAELDKLSVEFAKELKNLGVRVTALESQKGANVKFTGDFRLRYDHSEDGIEAGLNDQSARLRLQAEGKVNDNWSVVGRFVSSNDLRASDTGTSDVKMNKMFAKGEYGDFGVRVGRIDVMPVYGIFFDDYMDGAEVSWNSDKFYAAARYGRLTNAADPKTPADLINNLGYMVEKGDATVYMAEVGALNIAKGLNLRAGYTYLDGSGWDMGVWEAGADYTFGESGFKLTGAALGTTGDKVFTEADDTAWFAQLGYKGAKASEKGSWGAFGGYRDFQDQVMIGGKSTFNTHGKGWYLGGSYTPASNVVLKAWYENMKPKYSLGFDDKSRDYVRAQAEFFF